MCRLCPIALLQTGRTMFGVKAVVAEADSVSESWPELWTFAHRGSCWASMRPGPSPDLLLSSCSCVNTDYDIFAWMHMVPSATLLEANIKKKKQVDFIIVSACKTFIYIYTYIYLLYIYIYLQVCVNQLWAWIHYRKQSGECFHKGPVYWWHRQVLPSSRQNNRIQSLWMWMTS